MTEHTGICICMGMPPMLPETVNANPHPNEWMVGTTKVADSGNDWWGILRTARECDKMRLFQDTHLDDWIS